MKVENINETKNLLYIMINKTYNPVAKLTKKKREREGTDTNIKNEETATTTETVDIKKIVGEYYVQLYPHKFDNLDKIDQFLGGKKKVYTHTHIHNIHTHTLPQLTLCEGDNFRSTMNIKSTI